MQATDRSDKKLYVRDRMRFVQNKLLDRVLAANTLFFVIGCVLLLSNILASRFPVVQYFMIIICMILTFILFYRKKLSYHIKLMTLLCLVNIFAIVNLYSFGLIGGGRNFLMFSILFTSIFATRKTTAIIFIVSILILLTFMILFIKGYLQLRFDTRNYIRTYYSWVIQIVSFVIFIGILVLVSSSLFRKIEELATESSEQVKQISLLNKGLETKVALRTKELEETNRSKDLILGIVAHDIKNKLSGIIGSLDLLSIPDSPPDKQEQKIYTDIAKKASLQTLDIVTDLLEYAKNESGEIELTNEKVNVNGLIAANIDIHRQQAAQKNITLTGSDTTTTLYCMLNYNKIFRVMDNLIMNAIKFTPEGGTISAKAKLQENSVIISVADSGIGIPNKFKADMFFPFSKSGRPGTSNEPSTGLGLAICKKIIDLHQGTIWFESTVGEGTTFFIKLPQVL